jgi:hypothetical protein
MAEIEDEDGASYYPRKREDWFNKKPGWNMVRAARRLKNILEELGIHSPNKKETDRYNERIKKSKRKEPPL